MKRIGNLYSKIYDMGNLILADQFARKGKSHQSGVKEFDKNPQSYLLALQQSLINKTYKTAPYVLKTIYEPKEREIAILPYIERILQHAILLVIEPILVSKYTADTYSSIKGRGIHAASYALRRGLIIKSDAIYYIQQDIQKFYPTIKHDILKAMLRRIFKDADLLGLLGIIIDSAPGLPIGNYLSQFLANLYLTGLDRHIKNIFKVKYYRYADDIIVLGNDKKILHQIAAEITNYCLEHLDLVVKPNYRLAPVATGIDWVGYVHYPGYTLMRPEIKRRFARAVYRRKSKQVISAYRGWADHCNSRNLIKKLLPNGYD